MNNPELSELYLYQHFSSDGHTLDDLLIMPIEEIQVLEGECITPAAKRLQREEYWYKELKSIYPYGLYDNVRKVGNISKNKGTVVWTLYNKQTRKIRKRQVTIYN